MTKADYLFSQIEFYFSWSDSVGIALGIIRGLKQRKVYKILQDNYLNALCDYQ